MLRKPTRPRMVDMPRRNPSLQLMTRCSEQNPHRRPALKQPTLQDRSVQPQAKRKQVRFSSRSTQSKRPLSRPPVTSGSLEPKTALPQRVIISSYALDAHSLLREILTEKTKDLGAVTNYKLQAWPPLVPCDVKPVAKYSHIPTVTSTERSRTSRPPAFPGVRIHRLWKLKPGFYPLVETNPERKEVFLRMKKSVVRTPLPPGVPLPPEKCDNTYLEISTPESWQQDHRVTARWVSV